MALRNKGREDRPAAQPSDSASGSARSAHHGDVGESVEECVAIGQALVQSGHLPADQLQGALTDGKGDLWTFGQFVLTKYAVGRAEYAAALAKACDLPVADPRSLVVDKSMADEV
ncbi:MAG: hypothetical protein RLZZ01_143, partial [Actinomycetota bacterium]